MTGFVVKSKAENKYLNPVGMYGEWVDLPYAARYKTRDEAEDEAAVYNGWVSEILLQA